MEHGERDAKNTIYKLLYKTDEEITNRIHSPMELRFYNKDRQQKHEERMREVFQKFIDREKTKVFEAKEKKKQEKQQKEERPHRKSNDHDGIDNFNN